MSEAAEAVDSLDIGQDMPSPPASLATRGRVESEIKRDNMETLFVDAEDNVLPKKTARVKVAPPSKSDIQTSPILSAKGLSGSFDSLNISFAPLPPPSPQRKTGHVRVPSDLSAVTAVAAASSSAPTAKQTAKSSAKQSSSSATHAPRRGKWTPNEEKYLNLVVKLFYCGLLKIQHGTPLRIFLSKCLACSPMRISKKFTGKEAIGKVRYKVEARMSERTLSMDRKEIISSGESLKTSREAFILEALKEAVSTKGQTGPTDEAHLRSIVPTHEVQIDELSEAELKKYKKETTKRRPKKSSNRDNNNSMEAMMSFEAGAAGAQGFETFGRERIPTEKKEPKGRQKPSASMSEFLNDSSLDEVLEDWFKSPQGAGMMDPESLLLNPFDDWSTIMGDAPPTRFGNPTEYVTIVSRDATKYKLNGMFDNGMYVGKIEKIDYERNELTVRVEKERHVEGARPGRFGQLKKSDLKKRGRPS